MPVIAIVGAGPGLGLAIARVFGAQDYRVALLSRRITNLEPIVAELARAGVEAAAFRADVLDRSSIVDGLTAAKKKLGAIDVLEYSPTGWTLPKVPATGLTYGNVQIHLDFYVHGAVAAVRQVLPSMINRRRGSILFTTSMSPTDARGGRDGYANASLATAGLRSWAIALHAAVANKGVQVGHIAIRPQDRREPDVIPGATLDAIAPLYWYLHTHTDQIEKIVFTFSSRNARKTRAEEPRDPPGP